MGNGPQTPGDWDSSGAGEPPAQLLRRAISHVESLLHRLENPGGEDPSSARPAAGERAAETAGSAKAAEPEYNVVELSRSAAETPQTAQPHEPPVEAAALIDPGESAYVPLSGVSSTAQAEALRITLHAHEEAHRVRAEANNLRAEAAADGERILVEARMLSDRLHVESRDRATELLNAAKNEAAAIIANAHAEAERLQRAAHEDFEAARVELEARAEQERHDAASAVLATARQDAERIRAEAREQGRAEADRLVAAEVAAAAAEGRRAVEASRARAAELLAAANDSVAEVRSTMRHLIDALGDRLVSFNAAVGSLDVLRDAVGELAPSEDLGPEVVELADTRRPLGLLFGAHRG